MLTRSSYQRSPSVQIIPPLAGNNVAPAALIGPLPILREDKRVSGVLYSLQWHRGRVESFSTLPLAGGQKIPDISVKKGFHSMPPQTKMFDITVCLAGSHRHRFRIFGYTTETGQINEGLRKVSPSVVWRGELVIFQLGETKAYLACPRVTKLILHKAIRL
ncbi:hypothetical protein PC9H_011254 [Pleurotus ostreatus]|uniref:Uncharacterized protein n=1 Tax=Pleurotus ostreatus TaxID=5322 RepID=A0A8H6ZIC2_PLEOS|nr:uncharacterized protein PC9H_011254 [Pleurotus ostreatus]KAF7420736.1 hypothetical protein PC9H_011254 [Pleurotus ostreatus]